MPLISNGVGTKGCDADGTADAKEGGYDTVHEEVRHERGVPRLLYTVSACVAKI